MTDASFGNDSLKAGAWTDIHRRGKALEVNNDAAAAESSEFY